MTLAKEMDVGEVNGLANALHSEPLAARLQQRAHMKSNAAHRIASAQRLCRTVELSKRNAKNIRLAV